MPGIPSKINYKSYALSQGLKEADVERLRYLIYCELETQISLNYAEKMSEALQKFAQDKSFVCKECLKQKIPEKTRMNSN